MEVITALGIVTGGYALYQAYDSTKHGEVKKQLRKALYEGELIHTQKRKDGKRFIQECRMTAFYKEDYGYDVSFRLPVGLTVSKFREKLEVLEMVMDAEIQLESQGQYVHLKIGQMPLESRMNYHEGIIKGKGLQIPLFSRFGVEIIDPSSEIGCNMLIGGPPGMGKSKFIDLTITLIYTQSKGKCHIEIINNKLVDTFVYRNLPNVNISESLKEAEAALDRAIEELEDRKRKLSKAGVVKASDYAEEYLSPYFIVIDEYARFADDEDFQDRVIEIAERGRSFDLHLVIATQRPDAKDVLKPRIKACCLTKLALKTATASNSRVIIETDDAFHLPEIQGRAILQKSGNKEVQIPFLSSEQQALLLKPYYKRIGENDRERPKDTDNVREIQSAKSGSNRQTGLQRYNKSIIDSD